MSKAENFQGQGLQRGQARQARRHARVGVAVGAHMFQLRHRPKGLGERVEVDLLDLTKLRVFARKGLRSVLVWVLLSSILSLFWVLDSAGQANTRIAVIMLGLVVLALVAPSLGVHRAIARGQEQSAGQRYSCRVSSHGR